MPVDWAGFVTKLTGASLAGPSTPFLAPDDKAGIGAVMIGVSRVADPTLGFDGVIVTSTLVGVLDVVYELFVASYKVLGGGGLRPSLFTGGGGCAISSQVRSRQPGHQ